MEPALDRPTVGDGNRAEVEARRHRLSRDSPCAIRDSRDSRIIRDSRDTSLSVSPLLTVGLLTTGVAAVERVGAGRVELAVAVRDRRTPWAPRTSPQHLAPIAYRLLPTLGGAVQRVGTAVELGAADHALLRPSQVNLRGLHPLLRAEIQWGLFTYTQNSYGRWELPWVQDLVNHCRNQAVHSLTELNLDDDTSFRARSAARSPASSAASFALWTRSM